MAKISKESPDIVDENLQKIREIFPSCVTEGKVDFEKLRNLLGDSLTSGEDTKPFSWAGRADALKVLQTTSKGTLIPDKDESVNFDETENIFIEGDNLEVLKLLRKSYYGRIKMIYIDPPYNTGNDFVYNDDFKDSIEGYLEQTGQTKGGVRMTANPETSGRFHSDWLTMMYPRLSLARSLLSEDGVIFVSIGEEEMYNLRLIMNEIFGEENFRNIIILRRYDKNINRQFIDQGLTSFNVGAEYVMVYSKDPYSKLNAVFREPSKERKTTGYWKGFWNDADRPTMRYEILGFEPQEGQWKWEENRAKRAIENYQEYLDKFSKKSIEEYWEETGKTKEFIRRKSSGKGKNKGVEHWIAPSAGILRNTLWHDVFASKPPGYDIPFDNAKNVEMIRELLNIALEENSTVLDFFAGSGSTADAVLHSNLEMNGSRKFICVQLPEKIEEDSEEYEAGYETIADICKERIRRAAKKIKEENRQQKLTGTKQDLGFKVFKLAKSNYRIWDDYDGKDPEELKKQAELFSKPLVDGYDDTDVIYEVIVKEGYGLNSRIEKVDVSTNMVYRVTDDNSSFFITLDAKIDAKTLDGLDLSKDTTLVCIDDSLDNSQKNNISMRCNLKTI